MSACRTIMLYMATVPEVRDHLLLLAGGCTLVVDRRRARTVITRRILLSVGAAGTTALAGVAAPTLRRGYWKFWVATVRECGGRAEREH